MNVNSFKPDICTPALADQRLTHLDHMADILWPD